MKFIKTLTFSFLMLVIMASFSQCSSTKKLQDKPPVTIAKKYFQHWIAGVQGGGGGTNVFIKVGSNKNNITLDSLYFRSKVEKITLEDDGVYVARFFSNDNVVSDDIIMSGNSKSEYGNTLKIKKEKFPFELSDNQCVISYKESGTIKYFKIDGLDEKESIPLPSPPGGNPF